MSHHTTSILANPSALLSYFYSILSINYVIVKNGTNPECFQHNNATVYDHGQKNLKHQFTNQMVYCHSYRIVRVYVSESTSY